MLALIPALVGCLQPAPADTDLEVAPPPVTATIGPEGGTVDVPCAGGATMSLQFPAGAVDAPFDLTVTPELPAAGELFRVALLPRSMLFDAPVHVHVALPAELAPEALSALEVSGRFVGATISPGPRTVDADVAMWAGTDPATSPFARTGSSSTGTGGANGTEAAVLAQVAVLDRMQQAQDLLDAMEANPEPNNALPLRDLLNDLAINTPSTDVQEFLDDAQLRACQAADNLRTSLSLIDGYDELNGKALPILSWEAVLKPLDRDACDASAADAALQPLADSEVAFDAGPADAAVPGTAGWDDLVGELDNTSRLSAEANALEVTGVQTMLETRVIRPIIDSLRPPAWDACRSSGDQRALGDLLRRIQTLGMPSDPTAAQLITDIRSCATQMTYDSRDANDNSMDLGTVEGVRPPATPHLEAGVAVTATGKVTLGGSLKAFTCDTGDLDTENILVTANGASFATLVPTGGEYLPVASFQVSDLLTAAGVTPQQGAQVHLAFQRQGTGCGGVYGAGSHTVAMLDLNVDLGPIVGLYHGTATFYDALGNVSRTSNEEIVVGVDQIGYVTESFPDQNGAMALYWELPQVFPYGWTPPTFIVRSATGSVVVNADGSAVLTFVFRDDGEGFDHDFVGHRDPI